MARPVALDTQLDERDALLWQAQVQVLTAAWGMAPGPPSAWPAESPCPSTSTQSSTCGTPVAEPSVGATPHRAHVRLRVQPPVLFRHDA